VFEFESGVTHIGKTKREKEVTPMPKKRKTKRRKLKRVSVRAELRPEPDWDKFAYALLQHTRLVTAAKEAEAKNGKGQRKP
jgi:hypothetical protein